MKMGAVPKKHRIVLACLFLALVDLAVYSRAVRHDFVDYDDDVYVTGNRFVKAGLSGTSIHWAFTTGHGGNWHPLTWLSHMLDVELFGLNPAGHHMTSVALHIANSILLFLVFLSMTRAFWKSLVIAAFFAVHPLHVESVAWVAERKDVLSAFFFLSTLLAYVRYCRKPSAASYLPVFVLYALGLTAKPMLVTLPFVLLLLDFWPLRRMENPILIPEASPEPPRGIVFRTASLRKLAAEKIPLFLLSAASSAITFIVQRRGGAVGSLEVYPLSVRLANALISYVKYIEKTVSPVGLAVFYPHPRTPLLSLKAAAAGAAVLLVTFLVVRFGRKYPFLPVGWLWYTGMLVPVIGIVQVGAQALADRYMYMPLTGLLTAAVWGIPELARHVRKGGSLLASCAVMLFMSYAATAFVQTGRWRDTESLFRHALAVTRDNHIAHNNLGAHEMDAGRIGEAYRHFAEAARIKPNYAEAHNNLALALESMGETDRALAHYDTALAIRPRYAEAMMNKASLLLERGDTAEAERLYEEAIRTEPDNAEAHYNLANLLVRLNRLDEAVEHYRRALELKPDFPEAHNNLAGALVYLERFDEAVSHYGKALELKPGYEEARRNLEQVLELTGKKK